MEHSCNMYIFELHSKHVLHGACSYGSENYTTGVLIDISFDREAELESCGISVPAVPDSYENWSCMFQVLEIKG